MYRLGTTRLAGLSRPAAIALVAALVVVMAGLVGLSLLPPPVASAAAPGGGDADMYSAIIARLRQGQAYYPAAHAELLANGFGTRSVFNWRTPFYSTLLSYFPTAGLAQAALGCLALLSAAATVLAVKARGVGEVVGLSLLLLLSLAAALAPGTIYFSEIATGLLILLSGSLYRLGRWPLGLAAGLVALFVRELAGIYVVVCLLLALRRRRWREVAVWLAGLVAYATYFAWHAAMVGAQLGPADPAYPEGWLQFGGLGFVLRTAQVNGVLFALPLWVTAIVLPLAGLGLAAGASPRAGVTVVAYLAAFTVVGKPFDNYWGAVYTPLLVFGFAVLPAAARDLWQSLRRSPPS